MKHLFLLLPLLVALEVRADWFRTAFEITGDEITVDYDRLVVDEGSSRFVSYLIFRNGAPIAANGLRFGGSANLPEQTSFVSGQIFAVDKEGLAAELPFNVRPTDEHFVQLLGESFGRVTLEPGVPLIPGDTDFDQDVDFADFLTLANNFKERSPLDPNVTVPNRNIGDFDGGGVTFEDFLVLADNFGFKLNASASVPEPHSGSLAFLVFVIFTLNIRGSYK